VIVSRYKRSAIVPVRTHAGEIAVHGRHIRGRWSLPIFSFFACVAFVAVIFVSPTGGPSAYASPVVEQYVAVQTQSVEASGSFTNQVSRDAYTITKPPPPKPVAPAAGTPDPGTAQAIALEMLTARGWGADEFNCLVALWNKESHWNVYANNVGSGAYGIPQALPGSKMASAGADWATNPATQITWGLGYIAGRYGTPCGAWSSSQSRGWY
jgi:hypothetical protein